MNTFLANFNSNPLSAILFKSKLQVKYIYIIARGI